MTTFATELRLPDYFGANWDALLDLLRDLSWVDSQEFVLVISNGESLARLRRHAHRILLEILTTAVGEWRAEQTGGESSRAFHVIVEDGLSMFKSQ